MGFFTRKKKENKQSSTETEQAKKVEKASEESAETKTEKNADAEQEKKPGFFASKWKSVKTGAGKLVKKGKKAFMCRWVKKVMGEYARIPLWGCWGIICSGGGY